LIQKWFVHLKYTAFLGVFAELRKATIIVMSVRLSVWKNSAPSGRIFMKPGV
jgi:hypothetical protein